MLPTFQIRGLRFCATDSSDLLDDSFSELESLTIGDSVKASGTGESSTGQEEKWTDIRLDKKEEYDEIIKEHPEAQLAYLDEDDGDKITVCSLPAFTTISSFTNC